MKKNRQFFFIFLFFFILFSSDKIYIKDTKENLSNAYNLKIMGYNKYFPRSGWLNYIFVITLSYVALPFCTAGNFC